MPKENAGKRKSRQRLGIYRMPKEKAGSDSAYKTKEKADIGHSLALPKKPRGFSAYPAVGERAVCPPHQR